MIDAGWYKGGGMRNILDPEQQEPNSLEIHEHRPFHKVLYNDDDDYYDSDDDNGISTTQSR